MTDKRELADRPADVTYSTPETLAKGYRTYQRFDLKLRRGDQIVDQQRDVMRADKIVAVLPVDIARQEVVLIRQFRIPAHLATGEGDMIEIVAGSVDGGEQAIDAARRECREEIGVAPAAIVELFSFLTTPGITDEQVRIFLASIDAEKALPRTAHEGEYIEVLRVTFDDAIAAVADNKMRNGPLLLALQWLALNRARLPALLSRSG